MKLEVGLKIYAQHHEGDGFYTEEVVEVLPNVIATKSLDYPGHPIYWWKIEDFKKYYHEDKEIHCNCWKE